MSAVPSRTLSPMANACRCLCAMFACLVPFVSPAEGAYMPVPWVFTDPKHDPYNHLQYIASNTLTAIAICEYFHCVWSGQCAVQEPIVEYYDCLSRRWVRFRESGKVRRRGSQCEARMLSYCPYHDIVAGTAFNIYGLFHCGYYCFACQVQPKCSCSSEPRPNLRF